MQGTDMSIHPVHLGLKGRAEVEPTFTGSMDWYTEYMKRHAADGPDARLVSLHTFTTSWDSWEMHPSGNEVVLCIAGSMTLHQEQAGGQTGTVTLGPGQYAINQPGTWHTADVEDTAMALFITAGVGTQHRPR